MSVDELVYLDNNATTRPCAEAVEAVRTAVEGSWGNPSSVHRFGQDARNVVEMSRASVAALFGVKPGEVTFTSGATEAIALAHRGVLLGLPEDRRGIVSTPVEHEAVRESIVSMSSGVSAVAGVRGRDAPMVEGGVVDADGLAAMLDELALAAEPGLDLGDAAQLGRVGALAGVGLVSIQWANNETGAIQPVREIGAVCRRRGVLFHSDATQWIGKMDGRVLRPGFGGDVDLDDARPWIDLLSCSAHKFHGPKGVGALVCRRGVGVTPSVLGSQEKGRRGGTENVAGIAGMGGAARAAMEWMSDGFVGGGEPVAAGPIRAMRDRLERALVERAGGVVNGPGSGGARLWNTTNVGFRGLEAEALLMLMSERGVAASAGAACSSGSLDPSPVLLAMGVGESLAHGSVRLSLSRETTEAEVERAIEVICAAVERLGRSAGVVGSG